MHTTVIDIEARFKDGISGASGSAISALERLARTKVFVKFNADASPFLKVINKAKSQAEKFGKSKLAARLEAVDKATRVMGSVWNFGLKIGSAVWRATVTVADKATAPIRSIFRLLRNPVFRIGTALGLGFGVNNMVNTYKDFEAAMSNVQAISGANERDMDALTAKAKERGAATKFTATQASEAMGYMAMAGWKPQDMLDGIDGIMNLAAASNESLASTSDIVTDAITAFGKTAKDSNHFADVMAAASANANTNVALLGESFKYVAPIAGAFNYSIEDTAIALGLMANAGVKGSQAGTSLRFAISSLNSPTANARVAMDKYGISLARSDGQSKTLLELTTDLRKTFGNLGVSAVDSTGALKDYDTIMSEASDSTRLSAEEMEKLSALSTIFGERALPGMLAMINAEEKDFNDLSTAIYGADGAAKRMADTMMNNLKGSLDLLKSAAEGAILTIMEKGGPSLRRFVDWLVGTMPKIGETVGNALDFIGTKIGWVSDTIKEITSGADWKFGSIGDKIKLLWNGLVADPLSDWWNGGGREKAIETAGNIGRDLGEILKTGLLTIFGMTDALSSGNSEALNAGASIAKSFVEGFAEGFDFSLVADKFKEALGNIWSAMPGWAKVLTGGISGSKVVGGLSQGVLDLFILSKAAKGVLGSASAGTGLLGTGANAAIATGAGNLAGGASLGAGALSIVGLGGIAGGVVGGATLLSGINDVLKGDKTRNQTDQKAQYAKGFSKIGGVGLGAFAGFKAGAAIGSIGGPAGMLIGAGFGGLVGWLGGNALSKHIRQTGDSAEALAEKQAKAAEESARLKAKMDKLIDTNLKSHFGDIALSADEMSRTINNMLGAESIQRVSTATAAIDTMKNSLSGAEQASNDFDRSLWLAGHGNSGGKATEAQINMLKESAETFSLSAKQYVTDAQYASQSAVRSLIKDEEQANALIKSTDKYFGDYQKRVGTLTEELNSQITKALENDGIISIDEEGSIQKIRSQINNILSELANQDFEAKMNVLEARAGGGDLTPETFLDLMNQAHETAKGLENSRWDEYGYASVGQSEEGKKALQKGVYDENIASFLGVGNFGLDTIRNQYSRELGIFGANAAEILEENTRSEILTAAGNISDASRGAIGKMIDAMQPTTDEIKQLAQGYERLGHEVPKSVQRYLDSADFYAALADGPKAVEDWLGRQRIEGKFPVDIKPEAKVERIDIADAIGLNLATEKVFSVDANVQTNWTYDEFNDSWLSPDGQYSFSTNALVTAGWTIGGDKFNPVWISPDGEYSFPIDAQVAPQWSTANTFDPKMIAPGSAFTFNPNVNISPNEKYEKLSPKQEDFGIPKKMDSHTDIMASASAFAQKVSLTQDDFGIPRSLNAHTTVYITQNAVVSKSNINGYVSTNGIRKARGGIVGPNGPMGFAEGGMVRGGPQLVAVAEEGTPEMIIPLGSQRRQRGMQLWRRAGHMLGVEGFANGGIAGRFGRMPESSDFMPNVIKFPDPETFKLRKIRQENPKPLPRKKSRSANNGSAEVSVNIGDIHVTLNINVSGGNKEEVMSIVEENADEIANKIVGKINQALKNNLTNTPALGGETA